MITGKYSCINVAAVALLSVGSPGAILLIMRSENAIPQMHVVQITNAVKLINVLTTFHGDVFLIFISEKKGMNV
jgi:hypothetical protein